MLKKSLLAFSVLLILMLTSVYFLSKKATHDTYSKTEGAIPISAQSTQPRQIAEGIGSISPPPVTEMLRLDQGKVKLQLEQDRIKVIVEKDRSDQRTIGYRYEWVKNGQPLGGNEDSISGLQKGDKIEVKITPFDRERDGQPLLLNMSVANTSPKVIEDKPVSFDGKVLSHQVRATDPDGGRLSYSLVNAPKDMTIDNSTGLIRWHVGANEHGTYKVNVSVKNDSGAQTIYPLDIDIDRKAN
jgi:hypothetical protein